ncbi:carbohydrate kinase family protein [Chitinophaga tropicalis]|uniref:Carbohydrate kinase n=1 Tax=Chitinophaga tropicalis TaxID=2683588 RepID=A0A7K1U9Z1_9BACT|nr:carbohydrate kinase [Chitinophaga tropicalis]MVT11187.1 carbohydrate kinase [Chitinophaga tropicalis]
MTKYNIVSVGEVLWDILPEQELPGGAPMNAAYHLQKLQQQVAMVSKVGRDDHGGRLLQLMQRMQLSTSFIQVDETYSTGKVNAWMNENNDMQYEILYPVAWDHISWNRELEDLFRSGDLQYMIFGSLMVRHDITRRTLERALQSDVQKVLDINLRAPFYSHETLEWLMNSCDLLKLNGAELELISSWYGSFASHEERIQELSLRFNIPTVLVTLGGDGCIGYINGQFHYRQGIAVKVADTIGSGDAFLAGFLASRINGGTAEYSLTFANALGALVASKPGGCPEYDITEITALVKAPLHC